MPQSKKVIKTIMQIVLVLIVLAGGVIAAKVLIALREPPQRKEQKVIPPLAKVETVRKQDVQMFVRGNGTVRAKTLVQVVPQVPGRVVAIHSQLLDGGFVNKGETLVTIDPRDYELAVQRAEAGVARAQVKLDMEKEEAEVAHREWEQLHAGEQPASSLVFREPQIRQARAELASAQAELDTAKLNLERTRISLPFAGRVITKNADIGQYVVMGQSVATVYGTEAIEISVPLEDRELEWFDVPMNANKMSQDATGNTQSKAEVVADFAGAKHSWQGRVVRTEGQINPKTRMVHVVIEVKEPFKQTADNAVLQPGMFVEVVIAGRTLKDVFVISRSAVHNSDELWIAQDGILYIRKVEIARRDKRFVYVTAGLEEKADIVVSNLDIVTDQMKIRTIR
ncbi:MAG: efflux RND transporter periplasmic adaptor subunit, partial [Sedimentisphaerales bacterium]|nr:efflux RND transporter periplasmic adaptor subunit [Sedimentisphaerales bacterium]